MEHFDSNGLVIIGSLIIIISYLFNLVASRYSIPSVLLLIVLGVALQGLVSATGMKTPDLIPILEVLGTIGLIMIVLEASLDLELERGKRKVISRAFFTSLVTLLLSAVIIGWMMTIYLKVNMTTGLLYAVPLSIMSSAIIIPSVSALSSHKRELMVYESTFSDILGIMLFYFLISSMEAESVGEMGLDVLLNLSLTVLISLVASYLLIFLFQKIRTELKLFLLIAVLILLYAISKMFHLSSLLIILVFGLMLSNRRIFFPGKIRKYLDETQMSGIFDNFKMITLESSFVVRTFFFVIFGFTIILSSLVNIKVWLVSILVLAVLYGIRFAWFRLVIRKDIYPDIWMAPRGLITILLFFSIPENLAVAGFDDGILLLVILVSSITMAVSMIKYRKQPQKGVTLEVKGGMNDQLPADESLPPEEETVN
ncbi:MAG: sodium:proton exchanger [Bacteroidetes bacterium]|nr:MAG: sodium:proton exchanger [Bacteroidota bacterium]RLD93755.1 MAG: sodium:proton exchanger [Bacteroidota bacterium]